MIETLPLEQAPEAYARMMQGKAWLAWCWSPVEKDRDRDISTLVARGLHEGHVSRKLVSNA